jgi:fructokinase
VGGGITVAGRCLVGANLNTGEWGHNSLPWPTPDELPGPECYCGKRGCIETFISGPGFERDHAVRSGARLSSREIVRAAGQGDANAIGSLERYHDRLARGFAAVINLLDPDAIVLGGGMSNLPDLPTAVSALLPRYVFSDSVLTRVVANLHGDSSGVRGAAWLWPDG